mgnify:CR=1 FL=1
MQTIGYIKLFGDISSAVYENYPKVRLLKPVINKVFRTRKGRTKYIPLRDGEKINLGERTLIVKDFPGHTPGSVCLVGDGFILTGDTLFRGSAGRCDLAGGDQFALLKSLKRLCELSGNYTLYPGHGGSTDLQRERTNNPYMQD